MPQAYLHAGGDLLALGLPVSIRWSRGVEARAACGQLALLPDGPETISAQEAGS